MRRVVVGVVDTGKPEKLRHYLDALQRAGAETVVLRWNEGRDPVADATEFDAVLLCGGDDVDARHFGERNHPTVTPVPPARDAYEIPFTRTAVSAGVPLLGVCRGGQVLNVALGGSLEQHVPDIPGRGPHEEGTVHDIEIAPRSLLASIAEAAGVPLRVPVNSYHHQAVGRLAHGLRVTARSADGGVEAVESAAPFCVGVQWHPERPGNTEPFGQGLFEAFVRRVREARGSRLEA